MFEETKLIEPIYIQDPAVVHVFLFGCKIFVNKEEGKQTNRQRKQDETKPNQAKTKPSTTIATTAKSVTSLSQSVMTMRLRQN